jgi:hypothetical protein
VSTVSPGRETTGVGGIGYSTVAGIDNWSVTIHQ